MNKKILKIAKKEFEDLSEQYDKFINVFVDDWRGYRFVFDTIDVRKCKNDCQNCDLCKLLRNRKEMKGFSASLYPASPKDRKLFGPQKYLNCKTASQYQESFINYIKEQRNETEIVKELELIRDLAVIFSKEGINSTFKSLILSELIQTVGGKKRKLILEYAKRHPIE